MNTKLNIIINNPNDEAETIDWIYAICLEASRQKFEKALQQTMYHLLSSSYSSVYSATSQLSSKNPDISS